MKRRLAAALLIITLPLGMAACHTKSRKATPSAPAPVATASANPTQAPVATASANPTQAPVPTQAPGTSGQSVDEACSLVDNQLRSFADSYKDPSDSAQALAAAETTINALNSPQITNPDVKQASGKVASALSDMVNFSKKYQSNPNAADPNEAQRLTQNLTTSLLALGNLGPSILKYGPASEGSVIDRIALVGRPIGPPLQRYVRFSDESVLESALVEQLILLRGEIFHDLLILFELLGVHAHRVRLQDARVVRCGVPCGRNLIDGLFDLLVGDLLACLFIGVSPACADVRRAVPVSLRGFSSSLQASAFDWDPQAAMPRGRRVTRIAAAMRRFM